jgi:hypothetical protein
VVFALAGVSKDIERLCAADTLVEKLRAVLLNLVVVALLKNPVFCKKGVYFCL